MAEKKKKSASIEKRHNARLAAVQYLYQWKLSDKAPDIGLFVESCSERQLEMLSPEMKEEPDFAEAAVAPLTPPDFPFLRKMLAGLNEEYMTVRSFLQQQMEQGRAIERTSPLIQSLLEAGAYELIHHDNLKPNIVLSEYTAIAAGFFDNPELAFVNGTLQEVANTIHQA